MLHTIRLVVAGAAGRMGRAIVQTASRNSRFVLVAGLERTGHPHIGSDLGHCAGVLPLGVSLSDEPAQALSEADGVIDFSTPGSSRELITLSAQVGIPYVTGVTGFSDEEQEMIECASQRIPVIQSGNMSLGLNLLATLVKQAARLLDESFDIEIVEMHHRDKKDAPSGSALMLGKAAASGRGVILEQKAVHGRGAGTSPRRKGEIGFSSVRGGMVIGEHSVILAGESEMIELHHKAWDRGLFAMGALKALSWAQGKKAGLYGMADVLGLTEARV